jgi:hypothetical protein
MTLTLTAVHETERILALLAEITGRSPPVATTARQLLECANWRNQDRRAGGDSPRSAPGADDPGSPEIRSLTVASLFALVNWRNRPEEARPLPAAAETTVGSVLTTFAWE